MGLQQRFFATSLCNGLAAAVLIVPRGGDREDESCCAPCRQTNQSPVPEIRMVAVALKSPNHPVFAHVVVTRRCNLACTYCSEFDTSPSLFR